MAASLLPLAELRGHSDRVWCVAWSPSGKALASCSGDRTVRVWVEEAGQWVCKSILEGVHTRTVRCISWSPNGRYLASCGFDGLTVVWENRNGQFEVVATLEGHENEVKAVAWSASGKLLATCSRDKSVWIWEATPEGEYECLSVLHGHKQDVKFVRFHPSEEALFSASYDDEIRVWEEEDDDWLCSQTLAGHTSTVWALSFDRTGDRFVSCSDDRSLRIWQKQPVSSSASNGESKSAAGTSPHAQWQCVGVVSDAHLRTVYSVDWSKSTGLVASAGGDDTVRVFEEQLSGQGEQKVSLRQIVIKERAHNTDVNCVAWNSADGSILASGGDDHLVKIWRLQLPDQPRSTVL